MTSIITSLLFVISANIDNIALGISLGINKVNIPASKNILISFFTSLITGLFMWISKFSGTLINTNILKFFGSLLLIFIGIYYIIKFIMHKNDVYRDISNIKNIELKNMFLLIVTLITNNIALSLIASILGINIFYTTLSTFFISFIFLFAGNRLGQGLICNFLDKYSNFICGIILIILGTFNFFIA